MEPRAKRAPTPPAKESDQKSGLEDKAASETLDGDDPCTSDVDKKAAKEEEDRIKEVEQYNREVKEKQKEKQPTIARITRIVPKKIQKDWTSLRVAQALALSLTGVTKDKSSKEFLETIDRAIAGMDKDKKRSGREESTPGDNKIKGTEIVDDADDDDEDMDVGGANVVDDERNEKEGEKNLEKEFNLPGVNEGDAEHSKLCWAHYQISATNKETERSDIYENGAALYEGVAEGKPQVDIGWGRPEN